MLFTKPNTGTNLEHLLNLHLLCQAQFKTGQQMLFQTHLHEYAYKINHTSKKPAEICKMYAFQREAPSAV